MIILIHVGSDCVILLLLVVLHQVGEIEEQLAAARREVTKSEEANQKLQREVKEVCGANLHECVCVYKNTYEVYYFIFYNR